jgi:Site-specific recombinase XerD
MVADAEGQVADLTRKNKNASAQKIKNAIKGDENIDFLAYCDYWLTAKKNSYSYPTHCKNKSNLKKFKEFTGKETLYFDEITPQIISDYRFYCQVTKENKNHTVQNCMKIIKQVYDNLVSEKKLSPSEYPFTRTKYKKEPPKIRFVNKDSLNLIKDLETGDLGGDEKIKDMFLLSVYGSGLRFGDVISLQWKNIDFTDGRFFKKINKTEQLHGFKLSQSAIDILKRYHKENVKEDDFVFGLVKDEEKFLKDAVYKKRETSRIFHQVSKGLVRISKKIKYDGHITFHMSRHTFATNVLNNGMRIEHVSKLMNHSSVKMTEVYLHILNAELDKSIDQYVY